MHVRMLAPEEPQAPNEALPWSWGGAVLVCVDHRALAHPHSMFNCTGCDCFQQLCSSISEACQTLSVGPWQYHRMLVAGDD